MVIKNKYYKFSEGNLKKMRSKRTHLFVSLPNPDEKYIKRYKKNTLWYENGGIKMIKTLNFITAL